MYRKILVPLDGSEYSECVLEHVKALARGCQVKDVVIMYVVEPINPGVYEMPVLVTEDAGQKGQEFGTRYLAGVAAKLEEAGLTVKTEVLAGQVSSTILDYAAQNGIDLITMSTYGRSGISRWLMGSVADKVVRHSTVPVLLVRPMVNKVTS